MQLVKQGKCMIWIKVGTGFPKIRLKFDRYTQQSQN